jgi:hypothetical protein
MGEVWPEAQRRSLPSLALECPTQSSSLPTPIELLVAPGCSCVPAPGRPAASADQRRRIPQRPAPVLSLGRKRRGSRAHPAEPFDSFSERFLERASAGGHDFIFVSQVLFGSGRLFDKVEELAALGPTRAARGWWSTAIMPSWRSNRRSGGGGQVGFLPRRRLQICDGGGGLRLPARAARLRRAAADHRLVRRVRGSEAAARNAVGYRPDAMRFMGATFDPSGLYRFNAVRRMLAGNGLTTGPISSHVEALQRGLPRISRPCVRLGRAAQSAGRGPNARFLAFRTPHAQRWCASLPGGIASSMFAGTCFGSALASITTRATSTASPALRGAGARASRPRADPAGWRAGRLPRAFLAPHREAQGRGRRSFP